MSSRKIKGPLIAFSSGLVVCLIGVFGVELYCKQQIEQGLDSFSHKESGWWPTQEELRKKFPGGVFPELPPKVPGYKRYNQPPKRIFDGINVARPLPPGNYDQSSHLQIFSRRTGEILWERYFYFDEYKRRIDPAKIGKKKATKFLALFGDSNIYGWGLNEDQTLANYLSSLLPSVQVYNYAAPALFPYEIMEKTEYIDRAKEIPEQDGIGLYFFMAYHMRRNMGSISELSRPWNKMKRLVDVDENGELIKRGTFHEERPLWSRFTQYAAQSYIHRYFNLDLLPHEKDFKIQIAIIKKMQKNLLANGIKKFYVVFHPIHQRPRFTLELMSHLQKEKIPFISLTSWPMKDLVEGPVHLIIDAHCSGNANKVIARGLVRVLDKELSQ